MPEIFDKKRLFENIDYLIRESGKKIGEVEKNAGVSPGYISRSSKDGGAKPGIDFIMNVAEELHVSVDTLLKGNLATLTPTERYLLGFIEKLNEDTEAEKLDWEQEIGGNLFELKADSYGNTEHPLFHLEKYHVMNDNDEITPVQRVLFRSNSFGTDTYINGSCFHLELSKRNFLFIMNVSKTPFESNPELQALEAWMAVSSEETHFLCSNKGNLDLARDLNRLYATLTENMKHPQVKKDVRNIIDEFMRKGIKTASDDESDNNNPFGVGFDDKCPF